MLPTKQQALKLRLGGHSYTQINRALKIPKGTLSGWFSDLVLPTATRDKINRRARRLSLAALLKRNKNQTHLAVQRMNSLQKAGSKEIANLSKRDLHLIGVALYWAEGYKRLQIRGGKARTYHPVALTNSDPRLIKIFLRFLQEICKVPLHDIRAEIRLYEHMSETMVKKFWQKTTGIPLQNFGKVYNGVSKSSLGKRPFNRLPYWTLLLRVNRTVLFHTIMGWIEGIAKLG